jgi:hypothetical protein
MTVDPLGYYATNSYDAADRLIATTDALGNITTTLWDRKSDK